MAISFEVARANKIYLQAQPIIDAAAQATPEQFQDFGFSAGFFRVEDLRYEATIKTSMHQNMRALAGEGQLQIPAHVILGYSQTVASRLVRAKPAGLQLLSERGMLHPDSIPAIAARRDFDTMPVAQALLDMAFEYQNAKLPYPHQHIMLRRFLPLSYLEWMRGIYDVPEWLLFFAVRSYNFPHIVIEQTKSKADALVATGKVEPKKAFYVAVQNPSKALSILSGKTVQPLAGMARRAEQWSNMRILVNRSVYEQARKEKAYLLHGPILELATRMQMMKEDASLLQQSVLGSDYRDKLIVSFIKDLDEINRQKGFLIPFELISQHSGRVVVSLLNATPELCRSFIERGILSPEELDSFNKGETFDTRAIAEAVFDIIAEYQGKGLSPLNQHSMLRKFYPYSYLEWIIARNDKRKFSISSLFNAKGIPHIALGIAPDAEPVEKPIEIEAGKNILPIESQDVGSEPLVMPEAYLMAKQGKRYLQVQPIIDAGMRAEGTREKTRLHGRKKGLLESAYKEQLTDAMREAIFEIAKERDLNIPEPILLQDAQRAALSLLTIPPGLANDLITRGIISPEEDLALTAGELFDVRPIAEAVLDLIMEYQKEELSPLYQLYMMKRFFPVSYLKWIKARTDRTKTEIDYYMQNDAFPHVKLRISPDAAVREAIVKEKVVSPKVVDKPIKVKTKPIPIQTNLPIEINVSPETFEKARREKAYLKVQPMIDAAAQIAPEELGKYGFRRFHINAVYQRLLADILKKELGVLAQARGVQVADQALSGYSNTIVSSITRLSPLLLWHLSQRGIMPPEYVSLIVDEKPFDVKPLAEAAFNMIVQYQDPKLSLEQQLKLLRKFLPISYYNTLITSGCNTALLWNTIERYTFPHIMVERYSNLAKALIDKFKVPESSAMGLSFYHPIPARSALESTPEEAKRIFRRHNFLFEPRPEREAPKARPVKVLPQIPLVPMLMPDEVTAGMPEFKAAKGEKLYLQYQPIVDAAKADTEEGKGAVDAKTLPYLSVNEYGYKRKKLTAAISTALSDIWRRKPKAIERQIIPDYSRAIAGLLMSMSPSDLMGLADRGIISPEDAYLAGRREQFDVTDLAEAAFDLISGYRSAKIPFKGQLCLLKRFLPASYYDWTRKTYGLTDDQLFEFMSRNGLLHIEVENTNELANALVSKWKVRQKDAYTLARKYPLRARQAFDAKEPRAAANIFESHRFEFPISHFVSRAAAVQETIDSRSVFADAKKNKLYLAAEPIIKAGSNLSEEEMAKYELKHDIDNGYVKRLSGLIEESMRLLAQKGKLLVDQDQIPLYAMSVARGLVSCGTLSLIDISDRGIITRSSIISINNGKEFDTIPVAEAALDIAMEYERAKIDPKIAGISIGRLFPLSYLSWMKQTYNISDEEILLLTEKEGFPHRSYDRAGAMALAIEAKHGADFKSAMRVAEESIDDARKALNGTVSEAVRMFRKHGVPFKEKVDESSLRVIACIPSLAVKAGDVYYDDSLYFDRYLLHGRGKLTEGVVNKANELLLGYGTEVSIYDALFVIANYPRNAKEMMRAIVAIAGRLSKKHKINFQLAMYFAKKYTFSADTEYISAVEVSKKLSKDLEANSFISMFFVKMYRKEAEARLKDALAAADKIVGRIGIAKEDAMNYVMVYGKKAEIRVREDVAKARKLMREYAISLDDAMFCVQLFPGEPAYAAVEICGAIIRKNIVVSR